MQGSKIMTATSQKLANISDLPCYQPTGQIAGNLQYTSYTTNVTLMQYCPFTPELLSILRTGSFLLFRCLPLSIMARVWVQWQPNFRPFWDNETPSRLDIRPGGKQGRNGALAGI